MAAAVPPTQSGPTLEDAIGGRTNVAAWVRNAAQQHGLTSDPEPIDSFADAVSRLSDAEVPIDDVQRLLVALNRAGVVAGADSVRLHGAYLQQRRR